MSEYIFKEFEAELEDTIKYKIENQNQVLCFKTVIDLLINSSEFRLELSQVLKQSKFEGFYLEVKPCSTATLENDFEFVTVFGRHFGEFSMDVESFKEHFIDEEKTLSFKNRRGNSELIVPNNINPECNYAHLAVFLRTATNDEIDDFWKTIGLSYSKSINDKPVWLSTSGLGVHWLHMRIDQKPKYYRYSSFKKMV